MIPLVPARSIVNRQKNGWFGAEYNMNIYRGCCHGCIYCDSRSDCYQNPDFDTVKAKNKALEIIRNDLGSKRKAGVVATGSMSDPYNPYEKELLLTRHAMELLYAYNFGVAIATKSDLVTRDADVLTDIARQAPALVKITITSYEDDTAAKLEPAAPSSTRRFNAIKSLAQQGIYCGVLMMPLLPFINDTEDNVRNIVRKAADCGARFVYPSFGVTQRAGQAEHFYREMEKHYPGTPKKYARVFENKYICNSPNARRLYHAFVRECNIHKLLYKMSDIINEYKADKQTQMSMF